jgi:GTP pyrophosphokinase
VLGIIHHTWTPIQERIKDYIASPKSNAYQSLHTTIFGPGGQLFEVQIRTEDMHRTAEYGIAAHWVYKGAGDFLEFLKVDLYQDEIFVFTPDGDVKRLPKGATPIDFAFHVHTEVGLHCQGAKINGRIAPLHRELRNGETVEILTTSSARPSRDWLSHVHTARARHKIRQWIRQEEESVSARSSPGNSVVVASPPLPPTGWMRPPKDSALPTGNNWKSPWGAATCRSAR